MKELTYIIHPDADLEIQALTCQLVTQAVAGEPGFGELIIEIEDERRVPSQAKPNTPCNDPECPFCLPVYS